MSSHEPFLAAAGPLSGMSYETIQWGVAGLIVLAGLLIYGGRDLLRFSLMRARAVASVCFAESIRRRVLWLIPLGILGVILVSQFQRPLDDQDAVRQVTKFCLFASGLLVTATAVILACTNLPKEIENRVIFTVVTKPTTRLEILLGKIMGFAAISAVILSLMGMFSWGYLHYREAMLLGEIQTALKTPNQDEASRQSMQFYADNGLLDARYHVPPQDLQVWGRLNDPNDPMRWMGGRSEQIAYLPFEIGPDVAPHLPQRDVGMLVELNLPWEQRSLTPEEIPVQEQLAVSAGIDTASSSPSPMGPMLPGRKSAQGDVAVPAFVRINFATPASQFAPALNPEMINDGKPIPAMDPTGQKVIRIPVRAETVLQLARVGRFYLMVEGLSPGTFYRVGSNTARLVIPAAQGGLAIRPAAPFDRMSSSFAVRGRQSGSAQQIQGNTPETAAGGVFAFRGVQIPQGQERVSFELRSVIERMEDTEVAHTTVARVHMVSLQTGKSSPAVEVPVETRRTVRFDLPGDYAAGGDFNVVVQCLTPQHWINLQSDSLIMASADMGFGMNLLKGYVMLWLFSVLVVTVAVFCSTFLSWPIAIVLTLVILLGNWGVSQLGDMGPGMGRMVVGDLFSGVDPAVTETLSRSFEGLNSLLKMAALVLPDITSFGPMEELARGTWISFARLLEPMKVLVLFSLPILSLSYIFFRNKEVAP